jgi:hypothetical protein
MAWAWAVSSAASWTKKRAVSEKRWTKSVLGHQYQAQPASGDYIRDLFDRSDMVWARILGLLKAARSDVITLET